jgi:hypothetical protein
MAIPLRCLIYRNYCATVDSYLTHFSLKQYPLEPAYQRLTFSNSVEETHLPRAYADLPILSDHVSNLLSIQRVNFSLKCQVSLLFVIGCELHRSNQPD